MSFNKSHYLRSLLKIDQTIFDIHKGPNRRLHNGPNRPYTVHYLGNLLFYAETYFTTERPLKRSVSVCTRTGALRVDVLCLCTITVSPRLVGELESLKIFKVSGTHGGLYITSTSTVHLGSAILPGRDQIFLLVHDRPSTVVPLIMREGQVQGAFTIIAPLTSLHFYSDLNRASTTAGRGSLTTLHHLVATAVDELGRPIMRSLSLAFAGARQVWELVPLLKECQAAWLGLPESFQATYLSRLDQKLAPRIVDGYLLLSVSGRSMTRRAVEVGSEGVIYINDAVTIETTQVKWSYRVGDAWVPVPRAFPGVMPIDEEFTIGASIEAIVEVCRYAFGELLECVGTIRHVLNIGWEEVWDVVIEGPKNEQRAILCPHWLDLLALEQFDLALSVDEVKILWRFEH